MTTASQLARCYDRYASALKRGDEEAITEFVQWLAGFWDEGPSEPATRPSAVSPGLVGHGIRWYDRGDTILGYPIGGPVGCYQVPIDETPPPIATTSPPARDGSRPVPWGQYGARR